ncbi:hypothetical protein Hanom_Chr16g01491891 [Helianthus anomalus]
MPASLEGGVYGEAKKESLSSVVVKEAEKEKMVAKNGEKEKVEGKIEIVVKEKVEVGKGKGPVKADLPVFVPQWKVRTSDTTKSSDVCHNRLRNTANPVEKKGIVKVV